MISMDLEKLKMTGAGRAMALLTSGGDAQGHCKVNPTLLKCLKTHEAMLILLLRLCLDDLENMRLI